MMYTTAKVIVKRVSKYKYELDEVLRVELETNDEDKAYECYKDLTNYFSLMQDVEVGGYDAIYAVLKDGELWSY